MSNTSISFLSLSDDIHWELSKWLSVDDMISLSQSNSILRNSYGPLSWRHVELTNWKDPNNRLSRTHSTSRPIHFQAIANPLNYSWFQSKSVQTLDFSGKSRPPAGLILGSVTKQKYPALQNIVLPLGNVNSKQNLTHAQQQCELIMEIVMSGLNNIIQQSDCLTTEMIHFENVDPVFQICLDNITKDLLKGLALPLWGPKIINLRLDCTKNTTRDLDLANLCPNIEYLDLGDNQQLSAFQVAGRHLNYLPKLKYLEFTLDHKSPNFVSLNSVLNAIGRIPKSVSRFVLNIQPKYDVRIQQLESGNEEADLFGSLDLTEKLILSSVTDIHLESIDTAYSSKLLQYSYKNLIGICLGGDKIDYDVTDPALSANSLCACPSSTVKMLVVKFGPGVSVNSFVELAKTIDFSDLERLKLEFSDSNTDQDVDTVLNLFSNTPCLKDFLVLKNFKNLQQTTVLSLIDSASTSSQYLKYLKNSTLLR